ncbi:tetratricopeptide repeat protein [Actinomadura napierensis]|uniref:Orc1-like AAA ATPase domain-containing protein n=1 Tax=Actinomadura napierensis TaxID=267854 RepID=A0ABP5MAV2_9ACTN
MDLFVGRSEEQDRFRRVLAEAAAKPDGGLDEAHVVLVQGPGGIGKSMLLRRFVALAADPAGAGGSRCRVVIVDWEDDRRFHPEDYALFAGPPIWTILERIRAALGETVRGRRRRRRVDKAFEGFRRQAAGARDLAERARLLGVEPLVGRKPVTPDQVAKAAKSVVSLAGISPVTAPAAKTANTAIDAAAALTSAVRQGKPEPIDEAKYGALFDEPRAIVEAFTRAVNALASRRRPLVIVLDTCELLGDTGPWLREMMRGCGRHVVWVVGMRLEPMAGALADSEAKAFRREIPEQRMRLIELDRFDDDTVTGYLSRRLGDRAQEVNGARVIALTRGIPLAISLFCEMVEDLPAGRRLDDDVYGEITDDGTVSTVIAEMARRYLVHARRENTDLAADLPLLYGLALVHNERDHTRRSSFDYPFEWDAPAPAPEPVPVAKDAGLLAALWDRPADQVSAVLTGLARRHAFVHAGGRALHRDVRDAIRTFLLEPAARATVTAANKRATTYLRQQLQTLPHTTIDDQLADPTWRATTAAVLWHTCWADPADGIFLLRHLYPPAAVIQPSYARLLLDTTTPFAPYLAAPDQNTLTHLAALESWDPSREQALAAIQALTNAPDPLEPLLHGDIRPYLHLLHVQSARALALDLADQVTHLRRATRAFPPGSGPAATKIGELARSSSHTLNDPRTQPERLQKALIDAHKIDIRYNPDDAIAHNNLGDALTVLGRFTEAAAAYRKAIEINPAAAAAHSNLGYALNELGRFTEAAAACRKAIEITPPRRRPQQPRVRAV